MAYIVYGAAGVIAVLALFAGGAAAGWRAHKAWQAHTRKAVANELSEEERRRVADEQRAFESMLNYNLEQAYGMAKDLSEYAKE